MIMHESITNGYCSNQYAWKTIVVQDRYEKEKFVENAEECEEKDLSIIRTAIIQFSMWRNGSQDTLNH